MTFDSSIFDSRTGVLHIKSHDASIVNVTVGVLGGVDNLMWQYEKKENGYVIPLLVTLLLFICLIGYWISKYAKPKAGNVELIFSRQDLTFVLSLALSLYVVSCHIIFAIPGFNGVTVAMVTFFAFLVDFLIADSKLHNHWLMNLCNVIILFSLYLYTALYCDMFDAKKKNGKFDAADGTFGAFLGLMFAAALFCRFSFPTKIIQRTNNVVDDDRDIIIRIDTLFKTIVACICAFFFYEAWAVATCSRFLYLFSFLFLYGAIILSGIRLIVKIRNQSSILAFNIIWLLVITIAITMTLMHLTFPIHAWGNRLTPDFGKTWFKTLMLIAWGFVILVPVGTNYQSEASQIKKRVQDLAPFQARD